MVSETMRMAGSASCAMMRAGVARRQEVDHDAGDARRCMRPLPARPRWSASPAPAAFRGIVSSVERTPAPISAQSWSLPAIEQVVEIDRLMGAMEIADAEMHDAGALSAERS